MFQLGLEPSLFKQETFNFPYNLIKSKELLPEGVAAIITGLDRSTATLNINFVMVSSTYAICIFPAAEVSVYRAMSTRLDEVLR